MKLLLVFFLISLFFSVYIFREKTRKEFQLNKIASPFSFCEKWAIEPLSNEENEKIHKILSQSFSYFAEGSQSFAFLSQDGRYVLKFFRMKHFIPKTWLKFVPLPGLDRYRYNKTDRRIARRQELFSSYKMAFDEIRESTGLIYIHLNKTHELKRTISLKDKQGKVHLVELDRFEFVLQERSELLQDALSHLLAQGEQKMAIECIHHLFAEIVNQCKKGFVDQDSGINHNWGFIGKRPIHFDVGRLIKDERAKEPAYYQRELFRIAKKLENWLKIAHPQLLPYLEDALTAQLTPYMPLP